MEVLCASLQADISERLTSVYSARSLAGHGAKFLGVQHAVDAAGRDVETRDPGGARRPAARATAPVAPDRAARYAVVVLAFEAFQSVAAFGNRRCVLATPRRWEKRVRGSPGAFLRGVAAM